MTNFGLHSPMQDSPSPRSENLLSVDSTEQAALLLTNVATIASNEVNHRVLRKPRLFRADAPSLVSEHTVLSSSSTTTTVPMTCKCRNCCPQPLSSPSSDEDSNMSYDLLPDVQVAQCELPAPTASSSSSARTMSTIYKMPNKV